MAEPGLDRQKVAGLLVVALECDGPGWGIGAEALPTVIRHILVFLHGHLCLNPKNSAAVVAYTAHQSGLVFPSARGPQSATAAPEVADTGMQEQLAGLDDAVCAGVASFLKAARKAPKNGGGATRALSQALCYINRIDLESAEGNVTGDRSGAGGVGRESPKAGDGGRVLFITAGGNVGDRYLGMMNCMFAAQAKFVLVDACAVGGWGSRSTPEASTDVGGSAAAAAAATTPETSVTTPLQQAAYLTKGIYWETETPVKLLQLLITSFLAGSQARPYLTVVPHSSTSFAATCWCHHEAIDTGHACSDCLSVFCDEQLKEFKQKKKDNSTGGIVKCPRCDGSLER